MNNHQRSWQHFGVTHFFRFFDLREKFSNTLNTNFKSHPKLSPSIYAFQENFFNSERKTFQANYLALITPTSTVFLLFYYFYFLSKFFLKQKKFDENHFFCFFFFNIFEQRKKILKTNTQNWIISNLNKTFLSDSLINQQQLEENKNSWVPVKILRGTFRFKVITSGFNFSPRNFHSKIFSNSHEDFFTQFFFNFS